MPLDDRAMGVERRRPNHEPEIEAAVVRHQGRDLVLVLEDGEELVFDWQELRILIERPDPGAWLGADCVIRCDGGRS